METLDRARERGVYEGLARTDRFGRAWLLQELTDAGLRGRGGAGFTTGRKWASVASAASDRRVLLNGAEAEPLSWKDRWLLEQRPHLVLEGVLLAAMAVDAPSVHCYISDPKARAVFAAAAREATAAGVLDRAGLDQLDIVVVAAPAAYVAGEETAAIRYINGGPALPLLKPPRPFECGIDGRPTLVNNVETLAHAAWIAQRGAASFRQFGTPASPGTFLSCISGAVARPGLYEFPLGISLAEVLDLVGSDAGPPRGFLMGGYFSGFLPATGVAAALDYDGLRERFGSSLGNGSVVVLGQDDCPVRVASEVFAFFEAQSARQCGVCVDGTAALTRVALQFQAQDANPDQIQILRSRSSMLRRRGACQLLDAAAALAGSLVRWFEPDLLRHTNGTQCPDCDGRVPWETGVGPRAVPPSTGAGPIAKPIVVDVSQA
ncbi:MAG: NADH-ubiquinone oxidoreductase-F iron-sulfur binding region domain-containing protein [Actinomycetota bacterium]